VSLWLLIVVAEYHGDTEDTEDHRANRYCEV